MLQAVDKEVLNQINSWLQSGLSCWLATVVQTWGSSPRPVGSLLTCNSEGTVVGSLSGGCVEDDLLEKLTAGELAADGPQFFQYGITAEETEKLGLPCGGHLYIVVEPLHPSTDTQAHFRQLTTALAERRCAKRVVDLKQGSTAIVAPCSAAPLAWDEQNQVLEHTYGPAHQLFVIGSGMVSAYLAQMALSLDYEITVCDPRKDLLDQFSVAGVRKVADMPDDAVREYANDPATAIVALTHDPRIDDMGLMEALETEAFYIGAMGSTRSSASRRERLLALDLKAADIDRLHAPIGLPIGSKTPPEIAIAILAEITAVRKNRVTGSPRPCCRNRLTLDQPIETNRCCAFGSRFWPPLWQ
jgi:xanthine dehydrogenase accessory factor